MNKLVERPGRHIDTTDGGCRVPRLPDMPQTAAHADTEEVFGLDETDCVEVGDLPCRVVEPMLDVSKCSAYFIKLHFIADA